MAKIQKIGASIMSNGLGRFIPEPKNKVGGFSGVLRGLTDAASGVAKSVVSLDPSYEALLNKQIEVQQQLQAVSMESNIEKSRHESKMAAIRNIRSA
ncbi:MAG: hypothetical protein KDD53_05015 [Bdellovibrionales bacterium]|nr:hypothetical protein [Bdellovibrionales bacterium]